MKNYKHTPESYYPKHELAHIQENLKVILNKYNDDLVHDGSIRKLDSLYDDILQLLLTNTRILQNSYYYRTINSITYQSYNDLSALNHKLRRHMSNDVEITFKFGNSPLKITDTKVSKWIRQQLLNEINEWNIPSDFGLLRFIARIEDDKEIVNMLKSKATTKPLSRGYAIYLLCESIMDYLEGKNILKPHKAQYFSYPQIKFLFELLVIVNIEQLEGFNHLTDTPATSKVESFYQSLKRYKRKALKDKPTNSE